MRRTMAREDGRRPDELRPVTIKRHYIKHAEGSVLVATGDTRIICTASVIDQQPRFMRDQRIKKKGWVTAEYSMLPRSTSERMQREITRGGVSGRTQEIQRLIGRSLRAAVDLHALEERTVWVDCDVIQADGGTRTASITGAFIALWDACQGTGQKWQDRKHFLLPITSLQRVSVLSTVKHCWISVIRRIQQRMLI